ncbi:MAG: exopolysaccharide biosynthesis polyprenyl glycosylphosphotransferase [Candidatus Harrisonbacteria bacterium]|nr:exopolysaccharide biosynthesis polyprenyl glycosylphosphotransferase [Candidatus Harrisonbacteria bacterium]
MDSLSKLKQIILAIGDVIILYLALTLTLWLRYGSLFYAKFFNQHIEPFTIVFIIWIAVYYIAGLYDLPLLKNNLEFKKKFGATNLINTAIAALFFYGVLSYFSISPRANLAIFLSIFGTADYLWRHFYNWLMAKTDPESRLLLVGANKTAEEIADFLEKNPQLGYQTNYWMKEGLADKEFAHLAQIILANRINIIVIPAHLKKDSKAAKIIYQTLSLGVEVIDLASLYESLFQKVPLAELEEVWFLENITKNHKIYEIISGPLEFLLAFFLTILLLPLAILIAILIKITSPGSAFFTQRRIGKNNKEFTMWKFRTMRADAEKDGPKWANYHKDDRVTKIGKFLRWSHLDELPQLYNILRGELSFVGPRPEQPEFVKKLRQELPYYDLRHLTKPGITGWAQINYRYAASTADSYQKLQYDIYYIKNNSPLIDFLIILKTIKFLITNHS